MAKRIFWAAAVCGLLVLAGAVAIAWRPQSSPPPAAAVGEPGGAPEDVALAINNPDEYAWRLFFYINRQAEPGVAGVADPTRSIRRYDPDKPVIWETWALVSGKGKTQVGSEVFRPDGGDPGAWPALGRAPWPAKLLSARLTEVDGQPSKEIRINRQGYEFVRNRGLYNQDGLRRLYAEAVAENRPDLVQFPTGTKEIKAQWRDLGAIVAPAKLARYHWRRIDGHYWVLMGLHIATKDLPNWFWADFEHVDDPIPPADPSMDLTTRSEHGSNAPSRGDVEGERRELSGTKWAYYRLRGAQTGFTDARGEPIHFANSLIEAGFQHTSCMTCHARATVAVIGGQLTHLPPQPAHFDDAAGRPPAIADLTNPDLGSPTSTLFGKNRVVYLQTDFDWSIPLRAAASRGEARPAKVRLP